MSWPAWTTIVLGLWLIAAPFVLGYGVQSPTALYNDIAIGAAVAVLSFIAAVEQRHERLH